VLTDILFWVFVLLVVSRLAPVLARPEKIYEFPQFMAATFGIFILPQAVSLVRFPGAASESAVQRVLWMGCLCVAACITGYHLATPSRVSRPPLALHLGKLKQAGIVFVVCGLAASYLLRTINIQTNDFGGWTGPATVYGFFQQLAYPGFAICLLLMLHKWTTFSVGSTAIAAIVPLQSMIFGRREPAALFALSIGFIVYFRLRLRPPRWLIALSLAGAMLAIPATATYRQLRLDGDWNSVRQIELLDNFRRFLNDESVLELRNAAMLIDATRRSGGYQYGAGYWNHLVFRYVPAQILGQQFKESLMIKGNAELVDRELATLGYVNPIGSTVTGLGDSFQQFGYFGCLFFALLGTFFRRMWQAASAPDSIFSQLLYIATCVSAMRAVTHWTLDFLPGIVYSTLFLGAAAWYAHLPSRARPGRSLVLSERGHPATSLPHNTNHRPSILATMKIRTAPPNPPPSRRYNSE
jgi:hypothetical protein